MGGIAPALALLMCAAAAQPAAAQQEIALSPGDVRLAPGESRSFDFGTVPQRNATVLLDLQARLDSRRLAGSMHLMRLLLNGREVRPAKTRTGNRLLNKDYLSPVAPGQRHPWSDGGVWRVLYAPDFDAALGLSFYEGNPYETLLDVTDLTKPAAGNRLTIVNEFKPGSTAGAGISGDLVLRDVSVRVVAGQSPLLLPSLEDEDLVNSGAPGAGPARYAGKLLPGGGFSISAGRSTLLFGTLVSYPGGGLNRLGAAAATGGQQPGWRVEVETTADGGRVVAAGPDYRLTRTVRFAARKVEVTDEIANLDRGAKLGLLVENAVDLRGEHAKVRLAGNPDPIVNDYYSPGNPSVYVGLPGVGFGMLCEDDVYRNQATLFFDPARSAAGMRTERLALSPGSSYTLRWSIYPVASPDYWDFVNLVRQDWGANFTVDGAWTFFDPDAILAAPPERLREQFARQGIRRACSWGGWVDRERDPKRIGFGAAVLEPYWADLRERLRRAAAKIREVAPGCKVYLYYDTQRDSSEDGAVRFGDCCLTGPGGSATATGWGGRFSRTASVVATLENSFGKEMLRVVDEYLLGMKADGLYWDEMEAPGYGAPTISYDLWDGHSCELDPATHEIRREVGLTALLGAAHRAAVVRRVRALGGDLLGNGPGATRELLELRVPRMVEIQHNDYWGYEGNLQGVLGYGGERTDFGNWLRALDMATLLVGTRYDYDYDVQRFVFPFTPLELHPGYLLGRERIVTAHTGLYRWPGERSLVQVRFYDAAGRLGDRDFPTVVGGEARTAVTLGAGEAAVLERLPLTAEPRRGQATLSGVAYDPRGFRATVSAEGGCTLRATSGAMAVRPGQRFDVTVGAARSTAVADAAGALTVEVPPAAAPTTIEVRGGR